MNPLINIDTVGIYLDYKISLIDEALCDKRQCKIHYTKINHYIRENIFE